MTHIVLWLLLTVSWVGMRCVIVVFPDHTYMYFMLNEPDALGTAYIDQHKGVYEFSLNDKVPFNKGLK